MWNLRNFNVQNITKTKNYTEKNPMRIINYRYYYYYEEKTRF